MLSLGIPQVSLYASVKACTKTERFKYKYSNKYIKRVVLEYSKVYILQVPKLFARSNLEHGGSSRPIIAIKKEC